MLCYPSMLVGPAKDAGMETPEDPEDFSSYDYPHFQVFCVLQLGWSMRPGAHFDNAKVIAKFSEEQVRSVGKMHFFLAGFETSELVDIEVEAKCKIIKELREWGILDK